MRDRREWVGALLGDLREFAKDAKLHQLEEAIGATMIVAQVEMAGSAGRIPVSKESVSAVHEI